MPYFELLTNEELSDISGSNIDALPWSGQKVMFVHIPKTGGTSVEKYLKARSKIMTLITNYSGYLDGVSAQHLTLSTIYKQINNKHPDFPLSSQFDKIITIVRNPYTRIISDLLFYEHIHPKMTKKQVYQKMQYVLKLYDKNHSLEDGHFRPQYEYLMDPSTKKLYPNLIILHQETLNEDMLKLGWTDFNEYCNMANFRNSKNNVCFHSKDYEYLLNHQSIELINSVYDIDFSLFNYKKRNVITMNIFNY